MHVQQFSVDRVDKSEPSFFCYYFKPFFKNNLSNIKIRFPIHSLIYLSAEEHIMMIFASLCVRVLGLAFSDIFLET